MERCVIEVVGVSEQKRSVDFLDEARSIQEERAREYDQPDGERSMAKTVAMFNVVTGMELKESDGWLFMSLLKIVRDQSRTTVHVDACRDLVSYASLYAESRSAGQ